MRKISCALLLALLSTSQAFAANPERFQVVKHSKVNGYVDINNLHRKGDVVSYWLVWDYADGTGAQDPSIKGFNELNCVENKITTKQIVIYKEHMAKGAPSSSQTYTDGQFSFVVPGTIDESVRDFVCK